MGWRSFGWTLREAFQPSPVIGWVGKVTFFFSISADAFPLHSNALVICVPTPPPPPFLLLEKELTAVQINQKDLINLAPTHTSNPETRQAINSANYLLLEVEWGGGETCPCPFICTHQPHGFLKMVLDGCMEPRFVFAITSGTSFSIGGPDYFLLSYPRGIFSCSIGASDNVYWTARCTHLVQMEISRFKQSWNTWKSHGI